MFLKAIGVRTFFILLSLSFAMITGQAQDKMKPEDIIAKHVASIGKSDILADSKHLMAIAGCEFVSHKPALTFKGRSVLASNGTDLAFFTKFNSVDYPMERIGLFNDKVNIPPMTVGNRSLLGGFLHSYDKTLLSRLFGGSVFSTWRFFTSSSDGKMETEGRKKVGDRDAWVVSFTPKGGLTGGSYIKLYFDAENFHHLRTVYHQKEADTGFANSGGMSGGVGNWDAGMANNGHTLTEDFTDFHSDKGLVLPHKYSITFLTDGAVGTNEIQYIFTIEEYRLIKDFPADFFSFKTAA